MGIWKQLKHRWEQRRIRQLGLTREQWETAIADWPVAQRYQGEAREQLWTLTLRFLAHKTIASGGGYPFDDTQRLKLATMACVPILHLGLAWYDHFYTVILYEGDFIPNRPYRSEDGVVHASAPGLSGEAWQQGPVILSWSAIQSAGAHGRHGQASNVVIHEFAHKLDMLRDGANGAPPMHPDMRAGEWHQVFSQAWQALHQDQSRHHHLPLDPYALTHPAEFFAVCSETFFEAPLQLQQHLPDVYRLLCQFYRQSPAD